MVHSFTAIALAAAAGQTVHTVDDTPGSGADFAEIQDAVLAAADGDTILVAAGSYAPIVVDGKDLAIVGEMPGSVKVLGTSRVQNQGSSQVVLLHNLSFLGQDGEALIVHQVAGTLWIEECAVESQNMSGTGDTALAIDGAADVRLLWSLARGGNGVTAGFGHGTKGGSGLSVRASTLQVYDTTVLGGKGGDGAVFGLDGGGGGDAVVLEDTALRAWTSAFVGGAGGYADWCDCPGGLVCLNPGIGGTALVVPNPFPTPSIEILSTVLQPGLAGPGGGRCPDGLPGFTLIGLGPEDIVTLDELPRFFRVPSPVRDGGLAEIHVKAFTGDWTLVAIGPPSTPTAIQGMLGALFLDPVPGFQVFVAGPWDPSFLSIQVPVPQQTAGFQSQRFFLQAFVLASSGAIQLLGPSSVVVVDDGI